RLRRPARMSAGCRAIITGAGGFIGAALARRLLGEGVALTLAVRPGGDPWRVEGLREEAEVVALDLRDESAVAALVRDRRPDWVFHLAAHGAYSWQSDARRIAETNLLGTIALADACAAVDVEALVHAGSSSEYGPKDHPPAESEALAPDSAYAVATAAATHYCAHVARSRDLAAVTLRLYSAYGPWEEPRRLVPTLLAHA